MKFSIITPSFNQVRYLETTLRSVLENEGVDIEYIVIDGGSTDGSVDVIKKYADRLAYWCSEPDGGQYEAINKGFRHATGDILAWINSSDYYLPWTLPTVLEVFENFPETQWIASLRQLCVDGKSRYSNLGVRSGFSRNAMSLGYHGSRERPYFIQQETCFWTRALWEKIGGKIPSTYRFAADFHLWSLFFEHSPLTGLDCPLAAFRYHVSQRSQVSNYMEEVEAILTELRECTEVPPHNQIVPIVYTDSKKKRTDGHGAPQGAWSLKVQPNDDSVILYPHGEMDQLVKKNKQLRSKIERLQKEATLRYQLKRLFKRSRK